MLTTGTGRPRKPVAIRKAQGNPGKRALPAEPAYQPGEPRKPRFLTARARAIWNEEAPHLLAIGVLKTNHGPAFGAYCQTIADFEAVHARLEKEGWVGKDRFSQEKPHPLLAELGNLRRMIFVGANQFGATASAGSRVAGVESAPKNEFAELEIVQ
jgi:phage terminase small subunit